MNCGRCEDSSCEGTKLCDDNYIAGLERALELLTGVPDVSKPLSFISARNMKIAADGARLDYLETSCSSPVHQEQEEADGSATLFWDIKSEDEVISSGSDLRGAIDKAIEESHETPKA